MAPNQRSQVLRLLRELREASTSFVWHLNDTNPQGKRARTLAARRLMERARDLYRTVAPR